MNTSPLTKAARHAQIASILSQKAVPVRSQEELAELLGQRGVRVTQATLSRDLDELGAVRLRGADGALVYALPGEPGPGGLSGSLGALLAGGPFAPSAADPAARLIRVAAELLVSAEASAQPGRAAHPGRGGAAAGLGHRSRGLAGRPRHRRR